MAAVGAAIGVADGAEARRAGILPAPVLVGVALVVVLLVGLLIQLLSGADGRTYGDIAPLFEHRGIRPAHPPYLDRPLEYPVLIGYVMWLTSSVAHTGATFLYANAALLLAPLAAATTVVLYRHDARRAVLFAGAPTLALYAFHNWDIVPVAATVAGLLTLERDRPAAAGALLAVGAWAKLYPGLVLVAAAVVLLSRGRRDGALRLMVGGAVTSLALNLPVLLASWDGWWHPLHFQGDRTATRGSLWHYAAQLPGADGWHLGDPGVANVLALSSLAVGVSLAIRLAVRRDLGVLRVAAAVTVVFVLTNKVFSPQYTLWIVPFFVLLSLSTRLWVALMAVDVAMYAVVFGDFYGGDKLDIGLRGDLVAFLALGRAVVLAMVLREALRADRRADPVPRHPAAPAAPAAPA